MDDRDDVTWPLRMMSDYGCVFPLWEAGGCLAEDSLDLSAALVRDLLDWQDHFEEHFHYESGWDDEAAEQDYAVRGRSLHARVQVELGEPIALDLWPVESDVPGMPRKR